MTRINCIDPKDLCDKHLIAEYRELPRIAKLAQKAYNKNKDRKLPQTYILGTGHVLFFYNKGEYLSKRHNSICTEMLKRGFTVNFPNYPDDNHPKEWFNDWKPSKIDMELNLSRINERLGK